MGNEHGPRVAYIVFPIYEGANRNLECVRGFFLREAELKSLSSDTVSDDGEDCGQFCKLWVVSVILQNGNAGMIWHGK